MIKTTIADTVIHLPELDDIPVPKTRIALSRAIAAHEAYLKAMSDRDAATQARMDGPQLDSDRLARLYAEGSDIADVDPTELAKAAALAEADAYSVLRARQQAEFFAVGELRTAIDEERPVWATIAVANAKKGITKLTTATRMAEAARAELLNSIGVLGMLRGVSQAPNVIAVAQSPGGHTFDINPAVDHLRDAIVEASRELQELK